MSGPCFNIKTIFPRYGYSHIKDKTVGETVLSLTWESLYWQDGIPQDEDVFWYNAFFADALSTRHYSDVIMSTMASQITSLTIVYSNVYSGADQRKRQSSSSLAFVRGIHRWPVNSPHTGPVTRKMFPFDDVIMVRMPIEEVCKHMLGLIIWTFVSPN